MAGLLPEVPDADTYRVLHPRVDAWLPAAAAVAARHRLPAPGASDWLHGSELVFGAGPHAVLKISCPLYRQQHDAERRFLEAVTSAPGVGAPVLRATGEIEGWPYLVLSRVPGRPLKRAWPEVPEAHRERIAEDIGHRLALIHALPFRDLEDVYLPWAEFLPRQVANAVARHRRFGVPEGILERIPATIAAGGPHPRIGVPAVPIHADLTDENVHLVRERGRWRVAGILDFGDAMVGDPEYDLMVPGVFVAAGNRALLRAIFRGAGRVADVHDAGLPRRLMAWMLLHRFGTITPWVGRGPGPARATLEDVTAALWDPREELPSGTPPAGGAAGRAPGSRGGAAHPLLQSSQRKEATPMATTRSRTARPVKTGPKPAKPARSAGSAKPPASRMTLAEAMRALEEAGTAQNRKVYARHGGADPMFGVSFAFLKTLSKRIGVDHELALALWETGNLDARNLAAKVVDPARMTSSDLDRWARENCARMCGLYVAAVAGEGPHAAAKAARWPHAKDETTRRTGWGLVAHMAARDESTPDGWFAERLEAIERTIHGAPNFEREMMNQAVITIGGRNAALRRAAVAAARRIGKVEVDHGDTSCKTPEAVPYIEKMWAHAEAKRFDSPSAQERARESPRTRC